MPTARRLARALGRPGMLTYRVRRRLVGTVVSRASKNPVLHRFIPDDLARLVKASPELVVTAHRAEFVVARRVPYASPWRLPAATADAVCDALDAAGIDVFAMNPPYARTTRWGVRRDQLARAAQALSQALGPRGFYYRLEGATRPVHASLTAEELTSVTGFGVFQYVHCATQEKMHGPLDGCTIAVWDEDPTRETLVAPDRDSIVQEIDLAPSTARGTRTRWDGRTEPIIAGTDRGAGDIGFPVDAVYLWVDDSDPHWRSRRDDTRRALGLAAPTSPVDETTAAFRFRDRGELRASLRSLEMYAPWIRNIYLVTDNQQPEWLDAGHGRVKVVDHTEIFEDVDALPSYNSHAIGSQIHRIPGLSDHYLLMNDDVMFNRVVSPHDFFTPIGQLKIFFSRSRRPDISRERQTSLELARTNSAELLEKRFGRRASSLFGHVPVPQRKDIATEITEDYREEIARTVRSPFRKDTDVVVNSWLHLYTALFTGRGVRSRIRYGYFNIGRSAVRTKMDRAAYLRKFQVVCLNDVPPPEGEEEADSQWLAGWLERTFPARAAFERGAEPPGAQP